MKYLTAGVGDYGVVPLTELNLSVEKLSVTSGPVAYTAVKIVARSTEVCMETLAPLCSNTRRLRIIPPDPRLSLDAFLLLPKRIRI